ncbi:MAG: ABC transporter permease [Longimicrobiales bacterium]
MQTLVQDVRFAMRTLRKGWGVTAIAIASLALAIGGNTAVFGLINALLFQPLPFEEPDRLVAFQERRTAQPEGLSTLTVSLPAWADVAERTRAFDGWAAYRPTVVGLRSGERSEAVRAAHVSPGFFDVLGVRPARGRSFRADEAVEGGALVAVVTPEFWERTRGGDSDPLGAVLTLGGAPVEVVGVTPDGFSFLFAAVDVYLPLTDSPVDTPRDRRDVTAVARLAPGATMSGVRAEVRDVGQALALEHPAVSRDWTLDVFNVREDIPDSRSKIFYGLLQGSVFFVLLIACANIMNLLLARGQERRKEIALRTVLGAERSRVVRQLLTESGLLVTVGALLGLGLGWYGLHLMAARFAGALPPGYEPRLDATVLLFTAGVSVVAGLAFGLVPAFQTFRVGQAETLKEGGKASAGKGRRILVQGLVVAEIALSLVALGGGGMLVRTFLDLQSADPGFVGDDILTLQVRVPESTYPDGPRFQVLMEEVLARAAAVGGVRHAGLVNTLPQNFQAPTDTFRVAGAEVDPDAPRPEAFSLVASPGYTDVFGIEVLQGRFFEATDGPDAAPVAVVNRSFAERWLGGGDAVGRTVHVQGGPREVVGVVADITQVIFPNPGGVEDEAIYVPVAQAPRANYTVVVAGSGDPTALAEPLREALQSLDADLTLNRVLTMQEFVDQFFVGLDIFNTVLGGFGLLAILLASVGTYGVLAYSVGQRRHEIGIRMAVGAGGGAVVRLVARQGVAMSVLGLALGGLLMIPLATLVQNLLAGFVEVRTGTAWGVAGVLLAVTLLASFLPAWRAAAVSPVQALRTE